MFFTSWVVGIAAFIFYALIPVIGAIIVRNNWHSFRVNLAKMHALPLLDPLAVIGPRQSSSIPYKVYAEIDAVGEHDCLWIRGGDKTLMVDMHNVPVYIFTGNTSAGSTLPQDEEDYLDKIRWSSLPSLVQGARIFVAGMLESRDGMPTMTNKPDYPLLVILHDLSDGELLPRAIAAGRHKNEYWNPLTQISLALGIMVMSGLLTSILTGKTISLVMAISLTIAFSPILPLLPPGVFFFFVYRRFWRRALYFRAKRDVARVQGGNSVTEWSKMAVYSLIGSIGGFILALGVNAWLVFWILRNML